MKYVSFFSGIGGFEYAIQNTISNAECIGYSEIKKSALKVYRDNFPDHINLGDITKISNNDIKKLVTSSGGCHLIVGGFPCTNLTNFSTLCGKNQGLDGDQSILFYELVRVIKTIQKISYCRNVKFIIENNSSMKITDRNLITNTLKKNFKHVKVTNLDNALFGVQTRKRLFWTNFDIPIPDRKNTNCSQTWEDILEPIDKVQYLKLTDKRIEYLNQHVENNKKKEGLTYFIEKKNKSYKFIEEKSKYKSRIHKYSLHSDMGDELDNFYPTSYNIGKSRPILSCNNILIDRRNNNRNLFIIREFSPIELERLFGFDDNYTKSVSKTDRCKLLGNSVSVFVLKYILSFI